MLCSLKAPCSDDRRAAWSTSARSDTGKSCSSHRQVLHMGFNAHQRWRGPTDAPLANLETLRNLAERRRGDPTPGRQLQSVTTAGGTPRGNCPPARPGFWICPTFTVRTDIRASTGNRASYRHCRGGGDQATGDSVRQAGGQRIGDRRPPLNLRAVRHHRSCGEHQPE